ncbi:hypothetical protein QCA50_016923 [Cerrena zonata]|uniref:Uncharacterized protein n=1 Tax=Cerrena zonata TaxID=2478898 RepID=A0AAW0FRR0_9APHY
MFLGRGSGSPDDFRSLERATHFYERPIPLLHTFYTPYHSEHVIVNVGGLLFLRNSDEPLVYAVNEGVSLEQLLAFAAQGQLPTREVTLEASQDIVGYWFYSLMCYEREKKGRNRCLELYQRGGRVNARFLKPELPD